MDAKMSMGKDSAVTSVIVDDDIRFIDDGYEVSLKCHGHDIYIDKHTAREIIKFLEKAFIFERKHMKEDLQRCNHCMEVFDESLAECPNCGRDDALMHPFESYPGKIK